MTKVIKFINTRAFWFMLLILPIVIYAFTYIRAQTAPPTFKVFLEEKFEFTSASGITTELYANTSFKDFLDSINVSENTFITAGYMMNYMLLIEVIHLITDVVLMLPRLIQKGFKKMGLGDE